MGKQYTPVRMPDYTKHYDIVRILDSLAVKKDEFLEVGIAQHLDEVPKLMLQRHRTKRGEETIKEGILLNSTELDFLIASLNDNKNEISMALDWTMPKLHRADAGFTYYSAADRYK